MTKKILFCLLAVMVVAAMAAPKTVKSKRGDIAVAAFFGFGAGSEHFESPAICGSDSFAHIQFGKVGQSGKEAGQAAGGEGISEVNLSLPGEPLF